MKYSTSLLLLPLLFSCITSEEHHLRRPRVVEQVEESVGGKEEEEEERSRALATCGEFGSDETQTISLTNWERRMRGLGSVSCSAKLQRVAEEYSRKMCNSRCFGHDCDGSLSFRLNRANIGRWASGENVAVGYETPQTVMRAWMDSSGHRANILSRDFKHIAIGVYDCGRNKGGMYWTMLLANLKDSSTTPTTPQYPQPFEDPKDDRWKPADIGQPLPDSRDEPLYQHCGASDLEAETLSLVNKYRMDRNKLPLGCNAIANQVARAYSLRMCQTGCYGHNCYLANAAARLKERGLVVRMYSERIGRDFDSGDKIIRSWKSTILSSFVSEIGIGVHNCNGELIWDIIVFDEYSDF